VVRRPIKNIRGVKKRAVSGGGKGSSNRKKTKGPSIQKSARRSKDPKGKKTKEGRKTAHGKKLRRQNTPAMKGVGSKKIWKREKKAGKSTSLGEGLEKTEKLRPPISALLGGKGKLRSEKRVERVGAKGKQGGQTKPAAVRGRSFGVNS